MAINFTRYFTCVGKLVGALNEWNTARGSTLTARVSTLRTQFNGIDPDLEDTLSDNRDAAIDGAEAWPAYLGERAVAVLLAEVKADRPFADESTTGLLNELQRQMLVAGESLAVSTCTTTTAAIGSPVGTPRIVTSDLDAFTGGRGDYLLPDVLLLEAQGQEAYNLTGNAAVLPVSYPSWPGGAGLVSSVASVDPAASSLGIDPAFDQWDSGTVPTHWEVVSGTVSQDVDTPDGSDFSCEFLGTGALIKIRQPVSVTPGSVVGVHYDAKKYASPANTGTLVVRLEDAAGNALSGSVTVNVSAVTGAWLGYTGSLWVPASAPTVVYLAFRYTGGVGDGVRIDRLSVVEAPELYPAGLRLLVFRGPVATVPGDAWTLTTAVDGGALTGRLIRGLDRLMGVSSYPVRIPTSGSPTQADALVS